MHSYTWGIRVELKVGDKGRRSSYRGLLGWHGAQLSFGGDWGSLAFHDLIVLLRSGGLRWRSSNRVLSGLAGWELGFRDTYSAEPQPEGISAGSAAIAEPERLMGSSHAPSESAWGVRPAVEP